MQFNNNFHQLGTNEKGPQLNSQRQYDPYRMSHNELRQLIDKQAQRLEELKRLYEKEEMILNKTLNKNSYQSTQNINKFAMSNGGLHQSPIRLLSGTTAKKNPMKQQQSVKKQHLTEMQRLNGSRRIDKTYSHRYQYDSPETILRLMDRSQSPKRQYDSHIDRLSQVGNRHDKSIVRKRIVYDSPQKSLQRSPHKKQEVNVKRQNDKVTDQNTQSKNSIIKIKQAKYKNVLTSRPKNLKSRSKSSTLIHLTHQKSSISFKPIIISQNSPTAIKSQINQKIQTRLKLLSCVYKDSKLRNNKNQKDFLVNRFQFEGKGRKQLRGLINADPLILKKHKMVVE